MAELTAGIKMDGGELDSYISHFETLVCHAGPNIHEKLVLNTFTAGLPFTMYKEIYNLQPQPITYKQWRVATVEQQKKWVHLKGQQDVFKKQMDTFKTTNSKVNKPRGRGTFQAPRDPNVMDTSPGRTHAQLAEVEDFIPGGYQWGQSIKSPANQRPQGGNQNGSGGDIREVICYCCNEKGHMACSCPQKPQQPHQWQPHQGPSCNRQAEVEEQEQVLHAVCDDCTAEQRAQDWLSNNANEQDKVKQLVMQQVLGGGQGEDF